MDIKRRPVRRVRTTIRHRPGPGTSSQQPPIGSPEAPDLAASAAADADANTQRAGKPITEPAPPPEPPPVPEDTKGPHDDLWTAIAIVVAVLVILGLSLITGYPT
jgi:hypothetical protein